MASVAAPAVLALAVSGREGDRGAGSALGDLALRVRDGDALAFDRLMLETQERVVSLAWRMLGNREDALDAAQETFVRVYRHRRRIRGGEDLMGWIYRIAVNVCRDAGRRRRRSPIVVARAPEPAEGARAEQMLLEAERRARVLEALERLPPRQRAALVLRDLEGLTSDEVARIVGSRPGTVRAQIASARASIRAYCERAFGGTGGRTP